jgi:hypothetical protein
LEIERLPYRFYTFGVPPSYKFSDSAKPPKYA